MIPVFVLIGAFALLRGLGSWVPALAGWAPALRGALAIMFVLTASAHWGKRRPDLVRMVPTRFRHRELLVTLTGVLELLGAVGLLVPSAARWAAAGLATMLVAIFPANVRAARERLTIGGHSVPTLGVRAAIQLVFIAALLAVANTG